MNSILNRVSCAPNVNGSHTTDGSVDGIRGNERVSVDVLTSKDVRMSMDDVISRYVAVRAATLELASPLSAEDQCAQSMPDASPTKWHLGHTTWFFETFLLEPELPNYTSFDPAFTYLFNSYYEAVGPRQPRPHRGLITRPPLEEVLAYRRHVDLAMKRLLQGQLSTALMDFITLGLAHEEQHQELILSDILHLFAQSPLHPTYDPRRRRETARGEAEFVRLEGGLVEIGHDGRGFAFDNENPRHKVWLEPFELADRLVTNRQWLAFINDGGYRNPLLWLSDGWTVAQEEGWTAPIYWVPGDRDNAWMIMDLNGLHPMDLDAAVTHISYFEASAFAAWANARLPTEAEWEFAVATRGSDLREVFDVAWQWTASAYSPYPGFKPGAGAVGEYNGKFMCGQMVLRGGAATTPLGHTRPTYRNFYHPHKRWMLSGLRLARDADSEFAQDVLGWLPSPQNTPKAKFLYDAEGSRLFDAICRVPEYYLTSTEAALLRAISADLSAIIPSGAVLVEFGSGSSEKTHIVLDATPQLSTYVPIDISPTALEEAAQIIRAKYPRLKVMPLVADFTRALHLPRTLGGGPRVGFFPGSTIGNFTPEDAREFLRSARDLLGDDAFFIIGFDIAKDESTLMAAYGDAAGANRDFNKNFLARINRELSGDFDQSAFDHEPLWNKVESRMEMHLVSRCDQSFHVAGREFRLRRGESLHTENCYKFTAESFKSMVTDAGWTVQRCWINEWPRYALAVIRASSGGEKEESGGR